MIAFLIGLTFSFTYGNTFSTIYNNDINTINNPVFIEIPAVDPELMLEDWMFDFHFILPDYEKEIELEDWMLDMDNFFNAEDISEDLPVLEEWMLKKSFLQDYEQKEKELTLEDWMFHFS